MSVVSVVMLVLAMVSVQTGASFAKQLFPVWGPEATTLIRLSFAALMLCLLWRPWKAELERREVLKICAYGAVLGGMNSMFYLALQRVPLGVAVALEFIGPLFLALVLSRKLQDWVWAVLAVVGVFLLLPLAPIQGDLDQKGVVFALGAGGCWALYILIGQRISSKISSGVVTSLGMLTASAVVMPFGVVQMVQGGAQGKHTLSMLPLGILVALLSSAIPYTLEMKALRTMPTRTFSILMSLEPVIAALSGWILLRETLTPIQALAIFCVIGASLGSAWGARSETH